VALEDAVTLRDLVGSGNDDESKLGFVVVGHSRFSWIKRLCVEERKVGSSKPTPVKRFSPGLTSAFVIFGIMPESEASERLLAGNRLFNDPVNSRLKGSSHSGQ
jgi:hypothetical protein